MSDQNREDVHCMERLRNGDELALNDLMKRWKEPLVSFCMRYTGNLADARDSAQEVFVNVHGSRDRYRPKAAFSTWLFTIAVNLCRKRARWRSRHPEVLDADFESESKNACQTAAASVANDPGSETDRKALAADWESAIATLPHDMRAAFVLYEINGQRYREIGQVLKCTEKAVERRLAKARERLRAILEPKWRNTE